jgi:O-6-methylguanine DNA methyltransferase
MNERLFVAGFDTPIGNLRIASSDRGIAYLELPRATGCGHSGHGRRYFPDAEICEGFAPNREAIAQVTEYLEGKRERFELALDLRGTRFQLAVWGALAEIPCGELRSYAEIAREIGRPLAVRAVGNAAGSNPVPLVVPCHRVVAARGRLGGYAGGTAIKARLLALERDVLARSGAPNALGLL